MNTLIDDLCYAEELLTKMQNNFGAKKQERWGTWSGRKEDNAALGAHLKRNKIRVKITSHPISKQHTVLHVHPEDIHKSMQHIIKHSGTEAAHSISHALFKSATGHTTEPKDDIRAI